MSLVSLEDLLSLYRTPGPNSDPAIESLSSLRRIVRAAGSSFPLVRTRGFLTDIALPEDDGDLHFFIETEKGADLHDTPMQTCEVQGLFKLGAKKKGSDPRLPQFKLLFAEEVEATAFFRIWPEHLRDSREPHLTELHPLLTIGKVGAAPLDFHDRIVWPTGESEAEKSRVISTILAPPNGLALSSVGGRLVFATPSHGMKRENYVHVRGYFDGTLKKKGPFHAFSISESATSGTSIGCLALDATDVGQKLLTLKAGRYEMGGLCGLNVPALLAAKPAWVPQLAPLLSIKKVA